VSICTSLHILCRFAPPSTYCVDLHRPPYIVLICTALHILCRFAPPSIYCVDLHRPPLIVSICTALHILCRFAPPSTYCVDLHRPPLIVSICTVLHLLCRFAPPSIYCVDLHRPPHTMTMFRNDQFLSRMKCSPWSVIPDFVHFVPVVIIRHTASSAVWSVSLCRKYRMLTVVISYEGYAFSLIPSHFT